MISRKIVLWALALCLVASTSLAEETSQPTTQPAEEKTSKLVVISAWAKKKPDIQMKIQKRIINPLKANLSIAPFRTYKKKAKSFKFKRRDFHKPGTLHTVAKKMGITHALIFELERRTKKQIKAGKTVWGISVDLVEAETKTGIWAGSYEFPKKNFKAKDVSQILSKTIELLSPPEPKLAPVVEATPAVEPIPTAENGKPTPTDDDAAPPLKAIPTDTVASTEVPVTEPALEAPPSVEAVAAPTEETKSPSTIQLGAGIDGIWRIANLTGTGSSSDVTYNTGGFVPGLRLQAEGYLFEILDLSNEWIRRIGAYGEAMLSTLSPREYGNDIDSNYSGQYELGAIYRHCLPEVAQGAEVQARLGYQYTLFPVGEASFPGTKYHATSLAVKYSHPIPELPFTIPMVDSLSLSVQLGYRFGVFHSGKLKRLGRFDGAYGIDAEVGLYAHQEKFSLGILWNLDYFSSQYEGTTTLPKPNQFSDSKLSDSVHHLGLILGYDYDIL